ncbi:hypothetical protein LTR08_007073 [Meristemomyces frigidus]|nr:hypothetical protein LTR08_007073 [Meristemomyces frigidus]
MESRGTTTPRSSSRSKRSSTNLSDLRLAPLSTKFAEPAPHHARAAQNAYDQPAEKSFSRQHSSYLQGKSAPTTPGILSRSSSRRHVGGGLSRRGSLYEEENDVSYQYAAIASDQSSQVRADAGSRHIPKAKSEAALYVQRRLSGQGVPLQKKQNVRSKTGTSTPMPRHRPRDPDEDWLTRTRASTNALLQEARGQSWFASRDSATSLAYLNSDDSDDEGYEEMAAISASNARSRVDDDIPSPSATRVRNPAWGSRYGSRASSRRTSRRGSMTALRTPRVGPNGSTAGYFDEEPHALPTEPDFVDPEIEEGADESEVARLTGAQSFGLGGIVDRLMGFNFFTVEELEDTTDGEADPGAEVRSEVRERLTAEAKWKWKREQKLQMSPSAPSGRDSKGEQEEGGWQDAAWLLSVASKAMF